MDTRGHQFEVALSREHDQVVAATELRQQHVHGADLETLAATRVPQVSRFGVIGSVGQMLGVRPSVADASHVVGRTSDGQGAGTFP